MKTKILSVLLISSTTLFAQDMTEDKWKDDTPGAPMTTHVRCSSDNWTGNARIGEPSVHHNLDSKLEVWDHQMGYNSPLRLAGGDNSYMRFCTNTGPGYFNYQTQEGDAIITYSDDNHNQNTTKGLVFGSNNYSGFRLHPEVGMQIAGLQSNDDQVGMLDVFSLNCDREGIRSYTYCGTPSTQRIYSGGTFNTTPGGPGEQPTYTYATNFAVYADGHVRAREITVDLQTNWPDFVFEEDYELKSLSDVSSFINENGHLPEVPSAQEVDEGGIELGKMNAILLKKVEELTLYIIQQEKRLADLECSK